MLSSRLLELHKSPNLSTDGMITKDAKEEDKLYMHPHYSNACIYKRIANLLILHQGYKTPGKLMETETLYVLTKTK